LLRFFPLGLAGFVAIHELILTVRMAQIKADLSRYVESVG
jgi:hypothetical protein